MTNPQTRSLRSTSACFRSRSCQSRRISIPGLLDRHCASISLPTTTLAVRPAVQRLDSLKPSSCSFVGTLTGRSHDPPCRFSESSNLIPGCHPPLNPQILGELRRRLPALALGGSIDQGAVPPDPVIYDKRSPATGRTWPNKCLTVPL